jgi:hypothetical protein
MPTPGPAKYRDNSENPLSEDERRMIERFTSDPLSFSDQFIYWLNNQFIQNFEPLPHGAQLWLSADFTNPTAATPVVVPYDIVEHDTNAYLVGNTLVVPAKLGGVYAISAVFEYDTTNYGTTPAAAIFVNGVAVVVAPVPVTGTGFDMGTHMMLSRAIHLNGGDVVDVRTYKGGGTQVVKTTGASGIIAAFNIARIYEIDDYYIACVPPGVLTQAIIDPTGVDVFIGDTLTVTDDGTYSGTTPQTITYQWQYQNESSGAWIDIVGATASSILLSTYSGTEASGLDPLDRVRCAVTSTNACGADTSFTGNCRITAE